MSFRVGDSISQSPRYQFRGQSCKTEILYAKAETETGHSFQQVYFRKIGDKAMVMVLALTWFQPEIVVSDVKNSLADNFPEPAR